MEQAINWFKARRGRVTYSMKIRNGPKSYDCSSAVYYALKEAGLLPANTYIGNTDSLFGDLERNGFVRVPNDAQGNVSAQRGDVFIWGRRGASGGANGHTGVFLSEDNIIHCNYGYNGITINSHNQIAKWNGYPELTVYRFKGANAPKAAQYVEAIDQDVHIGSYIKFDKLYRVDDVQLIGGVWQVRTNALCKTGFVWNENGIPTEPLIEVTSDGYATSDQNLDVGSLYKIPGKFKVLDMGQSNGMWLAFIEHGGLKWWVDIETATEVSPDDKGTPSPGQKPKPKAQPKPVKKPKAKPVDIDKKVAVKKDTNEKPDTAHKESEDVNTSPKLRKDEKRNLGTKRNEKQPTKTEVSTPLREKDEPLRETKEKKMAQTQELKIATERALDTVEEVRDGAQDVVESFSLKTRIKVYIFADVIILLGITAPSIARVVDWDIDKGMIIGNMLVTAGTFMLTMFGLLKNTGK